MAIRIVSKALAVLAVSQLCPASAYSSAEREELELGAALHSDDQCEAGDAGSCAFNALQRRKIEIHAAEAETALLETETELGGDVRSEFLKVYNKSVFSLRPYINKLYVNVAAEEKQLDYTMSIIAKSENKTVNYDTSKGGFRPHMNSRYIKTLPARTRYLAFQLDYLQTLMAVWWERYTIVDRKRTGCLNVVGAKLNGPKYSVGCVDMYVKCMPWAKGGMCNGTYASYMSGKCPCSCQWIEEHPDWNKTVETENATNESNGTNMTTVEGATEAEDAGAFLQEMEELEVEGMLAELGAQITALEKVANDWGATTGERETHVVDLYKGITADITDALNKTKIENVNIKVMNVKVKAWLDMNSR